MDQRMDNLMVDQRSQTALRPSLSFMALLLGIAPLVSGCTPDSNSSSNLPTGAGVSAVATNAVTAGPAAASKGVKKPATLHSCSPDETAIFAAQDGDVIDAQNLPSGLYVASKIQMLIQKSSPAAGNERVVIRETIGGGGSGGDVEVSCGDGLDQFGFNFDASMIGLVQFEIDSAHALSAPVYRQVFFYQNKDAYGAIISNPGLQVPAPQSLPTIVSPSAAVLAGRVGPMVISHLRDSIYRIRYMRDRGDGWLLKLVADLDLN